MNLSDLTAPMEASGINRTLRSLAACLVFCGFVSSGAIADGLDDANTPAISPRIVGGMTTGIEQVPATVALLRTSQVTLDGDLFQAQFCGGTLIASRWILTAAHCVVDTAGEVADPESIMVLTGSDDLAAPVNQPIVVERIIAHEMYDSVELGYDIALLGLPVDAIGEPVAIDTQPVGIDEPAFIAGWGAINAGDNGDRQLFPSSLLGTSVEMTIGSVCGQRQLEYAPFTDDRSICAGVSEGGKDTCQGDSGGPLYRLDPNTGAVTGLSGITSWGVSCGVAEFPGIYTNVSAYTNWIESNMQASSLQIISLTGSDEQTTSVSNDDTTSLSDLSSGGGSGGALSPGILLSLSSLMFFRRRRNQ